MGSEIVRPSIRRPFRRLTNVSIIIDSESARARWRWFVGRTLSLYTLHIIIYVRIRLCVYTTAAAHQLIYIYIYIYGGGTELIFLLFALLSGPYVRNLKYIIIIIIIIIYSRVQLFYSRIFLIVSNLRRLMIFTDDSSIRSYPLSWSEFRIFRCFSTRFFFFFYLPDHILCTLYDKFSYSKSTRSDIRYHYRYCYYSL
jgi:hypothetical protein